MLDGGRAEALNGLRALLAAAVAAVALATATAVGAGGPAAPADDVLPVGTAQKVCQLTGEADRQYQPPQRPSAAPGPTPA